MSYFFLAADAIPVPTCRCAVMCSSILLSTAPHTTRPTHLPHSRPPSPQEISGCPSPSAARLHTGEGKLPRTASRERATHTPNPRPSFFVEGIALNTSGVEVRPHIIVRPIDNGVKHTYTPQLTLLEEAARGGVVRSEEPRGGSFLLHPPARVRYTPLHSRSRHGAPPTPPTAHLSRCRAHRASFSLSIRNNTRALSAKG